MAQFYSSLSSQSGKDASTTAEKFRILLKFILTKQTIAPLLATMWGHMDGCAKYYRCSPVIYTLSFLSLEFYITIYRAVVAPGY